MNESERFRREREIFSTAISLPASERAGYLERACRGDREMRARVDALIALDVDASDPLAGAIHQAAVNLTDADRDVPPQIGDYPILGEIGRGGMGVVYLAWDDRLKRRIAIKVLTPEFSNDGTSLARFQSEAQLLAAINHPGIATIYSFETAPDTHFITMELVDGENLRRRLDRGAMSIDEGFPIFRRIASALEVAHDRGVIHRDLKPTNVMVTRDQRIKVLDFGLAKQIDFSGQSARGDLFLGTAGYMSPEQINGEAIDFSTDVWSLGCVIYECIAGKPAFPGKSVPDRVDATLNADLDWDALPASLDDAVRTLLKNCLEKDRSQRWQRMPDIRRFFEEKIAASSFAASPSVRRQAPKPTDNLPMHLTRFVGRREVIARVDELLRANRLVTLTGAGGSGKTRLAIEVARAARDRFPGGAWIVEMAPLSETDSLAQTLAGVFGIKERIGHNVVQSIVDEICAWRVLLIMDNCEHMVAACAELVDEVLRSCGHLRILVTSREKLGLKGEINYKVPPLDLPPSQETSIEKLSEVEAVQLFVDRAQAESGTFQLSPDDAPTIVEICRRLDGIPLALELAAKRVGVLPLSEIAARLGDRFKLLAGSSRTTVPHHQTLRAMIDWSYDLLSDAEKVLFRRVSCFAGGWSLPAAESVCAGDGIEAWEVLDLLSNLVDKSLIEMDVQASKKCAQARYRMLDTVMAYAGDHLATEGETKSTRARHGDYFVGLAEEAQPELAGPNQALWLSRLNADQENFRLAIDFCSKASDPDPALRLTGALGPYWDVTGKFSEGRSRLRKVLERPDVTARTDARALALQWAGDLAYRQGDYVEAKALLEDSQAIRRELSDDLGIAATLDGLAGIANVQGDQERARELSTRSLDIYRRLDNQERIGDTLLDLAATEVRQMHYERARPLLEESLLIRERIQDSNGIISSLNFMGELTLGEGDLDLAESYLDRALHSARELGEVHSAAFALHVLGRVAEQKGNFERSLALQKESLEIRWEMRDRLCSARSLVALASLAASMGQMQRSARLLGGADSVFSSIQATLTPAYEHLRQQSLERIAAELPAATIKKEIQKGGSGTVDAIVVYALDSSDG